MERTLKQTNIQWDSSNKWYSVTFTGKIYKKECFKTIALDKNGNDIGEIISVESDLQNGEDTNSIHHPRRREVKIRISKGTEIPDTYYYEEYDENLGCDFGGTLVKSNIKKDGNYVIVTYTGYINKAC